ncbi:hypothetical protein R3P38DRAFT_3368298 [Favolaschia claudopus]|uniref:Uncharacterized protein n=1 Tax=Favolaschia claudopus TaxID=2862362 RepID=A0AAW0A6C5_9AGAR
MFVLRCRCTNGLGTLRQETPNIPRSVTYGYMAPFGRWEHGTGKYDTSAHFQKSDSCGLGASAITLASGEVLGVIGAQMKVIRISGRYDSANPPNLESSLPPTSAIPGSSPPPYRSITSGIDASVMHETSDARWTGIKALSSALVLPFLFKSTAALNFFVYHFTLFNQVSKLRYRYYRRTLTVLIVPFDLCLQWVAFKSSETSKLLPAMSSALSRGSRIDLYNESQVEFVEIGSISFRPSSFIRPGVVLLEVTLNWNWYKLSHRKPRFGPIPTLCRYESRGRNHASWPPAFSLFRLQRRNSAGFASDAEIMPLRSILFKFFTSNAETMLVSVQRPQPCLSTSSLLVSRLQRRNYASFVSGRIYVALGSRARAYTLEVIHTHLYQFGSSVNESLSS